MKSPGKVYSNQTLIKVLILAIVLILFQTHVGAVRFIETTAACNECFAQNNIVCRSR